MKSFIYAALFTAVLATPTRYGDSNRCFCPQPKIFCPQVYPESCECMFKAQEACINNLPSDCPRPEMNCPPLDNNTEKKCGGKGDDAPKCSDKQVCSFEGVFPWSPEDQGKCVEKTPVLKQKCGTRGSAPCPGGYKCYHKEDQTQVADLPGTCVVNSYNPSSQPTGSSSSGPTSPSSTGFFISSVSKSSSVIPTTSCTSSTETTQPTDRPKTCGGFAGILCPDGFKCSYEGNPPNVADLPGKCVPDNKISSKSSSVVTSKTSSAVPSTYVRPTTSAAVAY